MNVEHCERVCRDCRVLRTRLSSPMLAYLDAQEHPAAIPALIVDGRPGSLMNPRRFLAGGTAPGHNPSVANGGAGSVRVPSRLSPRCRSALKQMSSAVSSGAGVPGAAPAGVSAPKARRQSSSWGVDFCLSRRTDAPLPCRTCSINFTAPGRFGSYVRRTSGRCARDVPRPDPRWMPAKNPTRLIE